MPKGFEKRDPTKALKAMQKVSREIRSTGFKKYRASYQKKQARSYGEKKYVDTDLTTALGAVVATVNTNALVFPVNLTQVGADYFQRIGRKIKCKSLRLYGTVSHRYFPTVTAQNTTMSSMRIIVVWDNQPGGVAPTFDTIFGVTSPSGTETAFLFDKLRPDNMNRFKILRDMVIDAQLGAINSTGTENYTTTRYSFDEYLKLGGKTTSYSATATPPTIAQLNTGGLYVIFRATANDSSNQWAIDTTSNARFCFMDN